MNWYALKRNTNTGKFRTTPRNFQSVHVSLSDRASNSVCLHKIRVPKKQERAHRATTLQFSDRTRLYLDGCDSVSNQRKAGSEWIMQDPWALLRKTGQCSQKLQTVNRNPKTSKMKKIHGSQRPGRFTPFQRHQLSFP